LSISPFSVQESPSPIQAIMRTYYTAGCNGIS
jgi:hypothetical protein